MGYCSGNWCWWIIITMIFVTILMNGNVANSCWDHERDALLQLYSSVPHPNDHNYGWKDDVNNKTSSCCEWYGVTCGDNSRITSLTLFSISTSEEWQWHVNASIFLPFEELRVLNLSNNNIVTWTEDKGCTKLSSKLINLQVLDLSLNQLNNTILLHLSGFRSLKRLNLYSNGLAKAIKLQDIEAISKEIEELDLSINEITSISILNYNGCDEPKQRSHNPQFDGNNTSCLNVLQSLRLLDLSNNQISGEIPSWFRNLTNLEKLYLSKNQFTGNIGSSPLIHLLYLETLDISYNHLQIPDSFQSFENHTKLKHFVGDFNLIVHDIPKSNVQPLSMGLQLEILSLENCGLITFPSFLHLQHSLRLIDLSNNTFDEEFPMWLLENNFELEAIFLTNSSITGSLQLPSLIHANMTVINIDNNKIQGHIPRNIGVVYPNLYRLDLSNNILEGNIPSTLSDLKSLMVLYLSNNHLSGGIEELSTRCINLRTLDLSHNDFEGDLPSFQGLMSLESLILQGNNFVGSFSMNLFSDFLRFLDLSHNFIEGSIPNGICNKLFPFIVLDLSFNKLSGPLPNCSIQAYSLYLNNNRLSGDFPNAFFLKKRGLPILDLSNNELNGTLPAAISNLTFMYALVLRGNQFHGPIPRQLCELTGLTFLDLSSNSFQGTIPTCLSQNMPQNMNIHTDFIEGTTSITTPSDLSNFIVSYHSSHPVRYSNKVDFRTKYNAYEYKGIILDQMSGIDLSCNILTGQIPHELGNLSNLRGLNVSHNHLRGGIPTTFSKLENLESLDLSYNHLSGSIPIELTKLNTLAVFKISYNNLSGRIPFNEAGQFSTFDASSYYGNPFLCGPPLSKNCSADESPIINKNVSKDVDSDWSDKEIFYVTFAVSGVTVFLAVVIMMQINQNWLNASYFLVKTCITSSYYFIEDNFRKLRRVRHA